MDPVTLTTRTANKLVLLNRAAERRKPNALELPEAAHENLQNIPLVHCIKWGLYFYFGLYQGYPHAVDPVSLFNIMLIFGTELHRS